MSRRRNQISCDELWIFQVGIMSFRTKCNKFIESKKKLRKKADNYLIITRNAVREATFQI